MTERIRLDVLLVNRGLVPSRSRARDAIARGSVRVNGELARKSGQVVAEDSELDFCDDADGYVSRSALKLKFGLEYFKLNPTGCICLDLGASTGGFTQILLEHGASKVYAVDVGHGQLHSSLSNDPRVVSMEGVNSRDLKQEMFQDSPQFLVCDVSFISIELAIGPALDLVSPPAIGLFLIKPQFEVGQKLIGKNGVAFPDAAESASSRVRDWIDQREGWQSIGLVKSPILGKNGNQEYLLAAQLNTACN